ncbi:MAG: lipopolysaccharide biosynthesis protein [Phormidesmis sp.]
MSIEQKAIKGVFWSGIQNWGSQAGSLITFLVLARLLSPKDFGLVALANTFIVFFNLFIDQGFSTALVQRHKLEDAHVNTAFWVQLLLGIALTWLGISSAGWVAGFFQQPLLAPVLRWFSSLFLLSALSIVQRAMLKRKLAFKELAIRALLSIFLGGLVGIWMAIRGYGVWSLVGQQLTFEGVGVIVFWGFSSWRPKLQVSLRHLKDLSGFGISIFCSNVLTFFNNNSDTLLIGYFLGEVALGYYAIAYRVLQVLTQLLIGTGNQVALPVLSRFQAEPKRLANAFYKIIGYVSLIAIPTFMGVVSLARELVVVIFGKQWVTAIPMMQVLAFGGVFYLILFFNISVFVAMGQPHLRLRLEILNVVLNTVGCVIAVRWGVLAVAYAFAISDFLVIPASLWTLKHLMQISLKDYLRQFAAPSVCTALMVVLIGLLRYWLQDTLQPQLVLPICAFSGAVFYILCLQRFAPVLFQEIYSLVKTGFLGQSGKSKVEDYM